MKAQLDKVIKEPYKIVLKISNFSLHANSPSLILKSNLLSLIWRHLERLFPLVCWQQRQLPNFSDRLVSV